MGCDGGNLSSTIFFLVYNAVAVLIGVLYKDDCKNGADFYLLAAGGLGVAVSALTLVVILIMKYACQGKDIVKMCAVVWFLRLAVSITQVIVMFWGFGAIFPKYANWKNDEDSKKLDTYCASVPMMFAFVILTIKCIVFIFFSLIVSCCLCCCATRLAALFGASENEANKSGA